MNPHLEKVATPGYWIAYTGIFERQVLVECCVRVSERDVLQIRHAHITALVCRVTSEVQYCGRVTMQAMSLRGVQIDFRSGVLDAGTGGAIVTVAI